ncbi:MAG: nitrate/nitrite transporter [Candidatus Hydrogenedentota bacterium]
MADIRGFLKAGHKPTLAMSFLYFDVSFMIWILLGALGAYISHDFALSASQKGFLTAVPILGGALLRIPAGLLAERWGSKNTAMLGMGLTLVPLLGGWLFSDTWSQMLIVGVLLGVAGASFAVALPLASRWYPAQYQGLAMGIAGAGNSGTLLATLFAPRLAELFGWRGVFAIAAIPLSIVFLLFAVLAKESPNKPPPKAFKEYLYLLREPDAIRFCLMYSITFGGFVGLASFLSIFFNDQYGLSKVRAGDFTTLCVLAGSFFRAVGGHLADRFGGIRMLQVLFLVVAVSMTGVGMLPPLAIVTLLLFIGMMALGMGNGAVFQLVPLRFGPQVGIVTGIVGAAGGIGGFFLPTLMGVLKDLTGSYASGFMWFAAGSALCVGMLYSAQRIWTSSWVAHGGRALANS